ncbi:hypothetical protein [Marinobacter alexandrii]|uniref:hypothetical protein n=1 Tax=Marinobacter alexandrii TaxID=2570351 RepID=UPI001109F252|nr:hypothetical protein [Marinobacter alexandrii]
MPDDLESRLNSRIERSQKARGVLRNPVAAADMIIEARQIIADLVEYAERNDPGNPHIGKAKGLLSGGDR